MASIKVLVVEYVNDGYPGFAKAILKDVNGKEWIIEDKASHFSDSYLDDQSAYPFEGRIPCVIIQKFKGVQDRNCVQIDISSPIQMSSEDGTTTFNVFEEQILP